MKKGKAPTTDCCELSMTVPDIVESSLRVMLYSKTSLRVIKKFGVKMAV